MVQAAQPKSGHQQSIAGLKMSQNKKPRIRKVNGYIIYYDELIGQGQFGTVVKAQLASDVLPSAQSAMKNDHVVRSTVDHTKRIYACKCFDITNFTEEDMKLVFKEVKIHSLVRSDYTIRHYQTIKTSTKIYMIQEYANATDLEHLLEARGSLT